MNHQTIDCENCEQHLFDFHEGNLDAELALRIDRHLENCDACSELLADFWQMSLVSTRWQDETVPESNAYSRRRSWQGPQMFATAAALLALVMVLTDVHFVTSSDGITLKAGRSEYVSDSGLEAFRRDQDAAINERFQRLTAQQVASNQLMLRAALDTSRTERRDDFATFVTYWNSTQAQQYRQTREELQYLILSQAEDDKDIKQLNDAFQYLRRGNDM